ncbi:MAG: site-specific DNA-methyltransferase [Acidimicrobiaceae bacterium]|nr:site-specific DNA-methyltransferase [Acidimicrobiaceae bacterium]
MAIVPLDVNAISRPRRVVRGESTTDLILSSQTGDNAGVFRDILDLHVPDGALIADVTYGKGAFWRGVSLDKYVLLPSDLKTGVDFRDLPYEDGSLDALVLDPPYMEGLFRDDNTHLAGTGSHSAFRENYSDGSETDYSDGGPKYHDRVLSLYLEAGREAQRVLKPYGLFIVKCQDEVSANRQRLTHVELINAWEKSYYCKDLFVVTRTNKPGVSRILKQEHARKNHSYFLIFVKRDPEYPRRIRAPKGRSAKPKP